MVMPIDTANHRWYRFFISARYTICDRLISLLAHFFPDFFSSKFHSSLFDLNSFSFSLHFFVCRTFCEYGLVLTYLSGNTVYIVFIASSFQQVMNYELKVDWDVRYYIAVVTIPCILLGEIRKLKYLIPFSALANLCIVITFGITLWYMLTGPMPITERPGFSSWAQLPLFFRYVFRCFSSFILN